MPAVVVVVIFAICRGARSASRFAPADMQMGADLQHRAVMVETQIARRRHRMDFRRETKSQDAPREIAVFVRHLPPLYWTLGPMCGIGDFGGKIKMPLVPS